MQSFLGASWCIYIYKVCRLTFSLWRKMMTESTDEGFHRSNYAVFRLSSATIWPKEKRLHEHQQCSVQLLTHDDARTPASAAKGSLGSSKRHWKKSQLQQHETHETGASILHLCTSQRHHHATVGKRNMTFTATWQADVWNCNMIAWFLDSLYAMLGSFPAPQFEAWHAYHFASPSYKGQVTETALGQREINQLKWPCHRRSAQTLP